MQQETVGSRQIIRRSLTLTLGRHEEPGLDPATCPTNSSHKAFWGTSRRDLSQKLGSEFVGLVAVHTMGPVPSCVPTFKDSFKRIVDKCVVFHSSYKRLNPICSFIETSYSFLYCTNEKLYFTVNGWKHANFLSICNLHCSAIKYRCIHNFRPMKDLPHKR